MLTDDRLLELAGKPAFARGRVYHREGRVAILRQDANAIEATVDGNRSYALWLKRDGASVRWGCSCPAADDGAFCKHLVAAALTARDGACVQDATPQDTAPASRKKSRGGDLADFLRAQPAERLADWLMALADEHPAIAKQLRLQQAGDDPTALKAALGKLLDAGGFLDYRRSIDYAHRLDAVVAQLESVIARDADTGRTLCEYALGRLLKIYARSDDSAGAIGDQIGNIAQLHARACAAAPPGKALSKALLSLQHKDDWGMFALDSYWSALGPDGQADYGKCVVAEFETLPQGTSDEERWNESFSIARRTEAFARASGDFELLQRVLRRHLSHPRDHLRVLESLSEFGRPREALAWAEQAVKRFPGDEGLRGALAECLASAGLDEDAMEQAWQAFCSRPVCANWDLLKRFGGGQWPAWRTRMLEHVASLEHGDASQRITLLEHDDDFEGAVTLASETKVRPDLLEHLARRLEQDQPSLAGAFHLRIARIWLTDVQPSRYVALVRALQRASRCLPADQYKPVVAGVRAEHARKIKLMRLLDDAAL